MQEPKADRDEELSKKVHAMINGEETDEADVGNLGQMDQAQILAMLTRECKTASTACLCMV